MKIWVQVACLLGSLAALGGAPAALAASSPPETVVHIKDFKFAPTPLTVRVGDSVTFVNDDDEAHTVIASDKSFASQGLDTGNSFKHTFATAGTFTYFCGLHPYMNATVVVLAASKAS
ncbi:MAG: cupredoxin family copper-binding protein [Candidatus Eremiobacteraeota bacterium]|nr:cupredoxin family copper-binding protein [Candidatus Eremiobacteraeota bacterium]